MRVEVIARDGDSARFFVYDDHGQELYQSHRNIRRELIIARQMHESLASVILEFEKKRKDLIARP